VEDSKNPVEEKIQLSGEQVQAALSWLKQKCLKDPTCELCGHTHWDLQPHLMAPMIFSGNYVMGVTAYPHFSLICTHCGNTKLINAVMSGVVKKSGAEDGK
jgi:hypothetical protein